MGGMTRKLLGHDHALLSAVKNGEISAGEAVERFDRSPNWVWVAMAPESKLLSLLLDSRVFGPNVARERQGLEKALDK